MDSDHLVEVSVEERFVRRRGQTGGRKRWKRRWNEEVRREFDMKIERLKLKHGNLGEEWKEWRRELRKF